MLTIHKYPLLISDEQIIQMPRYAQILTIDMQHGGPHLWAMVETNEPLVDRVIMTRGTGHNAAAVGRYIGTIVIEEGGALVFHFFESP